MDEYELEEIKREIVESRSLSIKTNNLVNALASDVKSIAKRHQMQERRLLVNSATAYVVPIAAAILFALFALQSHGSGKVGRFFGPVMVVWFALLAVTGIAQISVNAVGSSLEPQFDGSVNIANAGPFSVGLRGCCVFRRGRVVFSQPACGQLANDWLGSGVASAGRNGTSPVRQAGRRRHAGRGPRHERRPRSASCAAR